MSDSNTNKRYPDSTFAVQYPYNQATITRGGHEIHVNDSPGEESLKIAHTKGTFVEINKDGRWTQVVVEKAYNYFKDGVTETVDGHKDVKIGGNLNHNVDNSINDAVGGERIISTGGDLLISTGGARIEHTSDDKAESVDGKFIGTYAKDHNISVGEDQVSLVNGIKKDLIGSDWQVTSQANVEIINTNGTFRIKCKEFIVEAETISLVTPKGTIRISSDMLISSDNNVNITGEEIHLNDS